MLWRLCVKTVISFLKPYQLPAIIAFSLTLFELAVELILPLFLGKMINTGILTKDMNSILMWGSIMIGLALASFVAGILNSFYASHVSNHVAYDMREKLFQKVQSFPYADLNRFPTSSLVTRFTNDVRQIQQTLFMALRIMARAPLLVIGGVVMAFVVNARLATIFLITVPLLIGLLAWILKRASRMFKQIQEKIDHVNLIMQENLVGMRLIKAFVRRNYEMNRFKKANKQLAQTTRSTFRFVEASSPILLFVMNMSILFILWFGNIQVVAGDTTVGEVVTITNYALRVSMAISMFSWITLGISRTIASANRVNEVIHWDHTEQNRTERQFSNNITGKITFNNVSFTYPNAPKRTLHKLNFTINPGEKIAIMGATGSGKTSLFQLIPRLYEVDSGDIFIDDQPLTSYNPIKLRELIGFVPQNPRLFSGTVADNIRWGKETATEDEVIQAAKEAQIHQTIMNLPNGYQTIISQRGVNLSGGQKQRISIARALVRKPKILILDDSTSALDLATEAKLLEAIWRDDCTILMSTQKVATAIKADRIILMDRGHIIAIGDHRTLLKHSPLYKRIVATQFGEELHHVN